MRHAADGLSLSFCDLVIMLLKTIGYCENGEVDYICLQNMQRRNYTVLSCLHQQIIEI